MRKILISAAVAAAATVAAASPASAQHRGYDQRYDQRYDDRRYDDRRYDDRDDRRGYGRDFVNRQAVHQLIRDLDRAEYQIQRGIQRGNISPREAHGLRREAENIRQRLHRASRDGLSHREFAQLRQRVSYLQQRVRYERRDRDDRRW